jgi:hypothetical protein
VDFQDIKASTQMGLVGAELKLWVEGGGTGFTKMEALRGTKLNELGGFYGTKL